MKNLLWIPFGCLIALGLVWVKPEVVHSLRERREILVATKGDGKKFLAGKIHDGVVISQDILLDSPMQSYVQGVQNPSLHLRLNLVNLHEDNRNGFLEATLWLAGKRFQARSGVRGKKEQAYRFDFSQGVDAADVPKTSTRLEIRGTGIPRDKSMACLLNIDQTTGRAALDGVPMKGALHFFLARVLSEPWYRYWAGVGLLAVICMTCALLAQVWLTTLLDKHALGDRVS